MPAGREKGTNAMVRHELHVDGMRCGMCEAHVNDIVRKAFAAAVASADSSLKSVRSSHVRNTTVIIAKSRLDLCPVINALEAEGYVVTSVKVS